MGFKIDFKSGFKSEPNGQVQVGEDSVEGEVLHPFFQKVFRPQSVSGSTWLLLIWGKGFKIDFKTGFKSAPIGQVQVGEDSVEGEVLHLFFQK